MLVLFACAASILLSPIICNIIGSAILHRVHPTAMDIPGHAVRAAAMATYSTWDAARAGAMGGSILIIPYLLLAALLNELVHNSSTWTTSVMAGFWGIVGTISSPFAGAIGAGILLPTIGGNKKSVIDSNTGLTRQVETFHQTIRESARAGAVGAGVWIAAWSAIALLAGLAYGLLVLVYAGKLWLHDKAEERRRKNMATRAGVGMQEDREGGDSLALQERTM